MGEQVINSDLLLNIIKESLNPIACVQVVDYEDEKAVKFVLFNEAFESLFGNQAEEMKASVFKLSDIEEMSGDDELLMSIPDVYKNDRAVYKLISVPYLGKSFNLKTFIPCEGYICLTLSDVTEFEKAKKEAQDMYALATSASEELKYKVNLLTMTQKQVANTNRIHEIVAMACGDGFFYKSYVDNTFFASETWYTLFTDDNVKPVDSKDMLNTICRMDLFNFTKWREKTIEDKKPNFVCEFRLYDESTWIEANYRFNYDESGKLIEEIACFKDVTTIKKQKEELAYKAYYDVATGLMNRTYFTKLLDEDIARAKEEDVTIDVIYIDIDDFKNINDSIGYKMADQYLLKFAMMLREYESETVRVARFDSDEFVISIYDGSRHAAQMIAMDIRKKLSDKMVLSNGLTQRFSVSIGINQYPDGGKNAVDLISNSDIALHKVKASGKNNILFFDEAMLEEFLVKIEMENTIKHAIDNDKFVLYYQPQYHTSTRKLRGVEALVRMKDEVLGFVPPTQFISLAERNGTIVDIGEWVLRKAFEDYKAWQEAYDFDGIISINISPIQFKQITFESTLYALLKEYKMKPENVEIEITESVFVDHEFQLVEMIKRIRNNGIKVSLDDFGTGYSSLSYLKSIPIDTLKIDKSFVESLGELKTSDIITGSVIEMMQKLGLEIIAEGVETEVQYEFLKKMNCNDIQGFYLSKPMSADAIRAVIREEKC